MIIKPDGNYTRYEKFIRFWSVLWGYFPLTPAGIILGGILTFAFLYYARGRQDFLLLIISLGTGGAALLGLLQILISLLLCRRVLKENQTLHLKGITGHPLKTGLVFKKYFFLPTLEMDGKWLYPESIECAYDFRGNEFEETILPNRRMQENLIIRKVVIRDIIGLFSVSMIREQKANLLFTPPSHAVKNFRLPSFFTHGDHFSHPEGRPVGDYIDLRSYRPGDPVNRINWKVFARSGKLLVKSPEKAYSIQDRTYAYLITGNEDGPSAGLAWNIFKNRLAGEFFTFGSDLADGSKEELEDIYKEIIQSGSVKGEETYLETFYREIPESRESSCLIFAPPEQGPWVNALINLSRIGYRHLHCVISLERYEFIKQSSRLERFLFTPYKSADHSRIKAEEICRQLKDSGIQADIFDTNKETLVKNSV